MYGIPAELETVAGRSYGSFPTFELWAGDRVANSNPRRTCADLSGAADGLYYVFPDGHDEVRVYCSGGRTLLAKATSSSPVTYLGDSSIKLTNAQIFALLNTSTTLSRVVTYNSNDYTQNLALTQGFTPGVSPHRQTLFYATWHGHSDSTPPVQDDSVTTLVLGEVEEGSGYNYWQQRNGVMYGLPGGLSGACSCSNGLFPTFEFWAA